MLQSPERITQGNHASNESSGTGDPTDRDNSFIGTASRVGTSSPIRVKRDINVRNNFTRNGTLKSAVAFAEISLQEFWADGITRMG
jgi:hypothetical protein